MARYRGRRMGDSDKMKHFVWYGMRWGLFPVGWFHKGTRTAVLGGDQAGNKPVDVMPVEVAGINVMLASGRDDVGGDEDDRGSDDTEGCRSEEELAGSVKRCQRSESESYSINELAPSQPVRNHLV